MITYIYPFRNREVERVKKSLDSLAEQNDKELEVVFVDYGSTPETASEVQHLLLKYSFVKYIYSYSNGKPWNRSKALNIGIKQAQTDYVLSADIDMIFHSSFNGLLKSLTDPIKVTFFKVGYLSKNETYDKNELVPESYSNQRAKGISLYPKEALFAINGFDEFFNCWGSEDEDVISRLMFYGLEMNFYNENTLVYHQYHKPFKELKHKLLSKELSYNQVRFHNDKKRKLNENAKTIKVNLDKNWGEIIDEERYNTLVNTPVSRTITSYKTDVDFFLFYELKTLNKGTWCFKFVEFVPDKNINFKSVLYRLWTIRNSDLKIKEEYSLKEVNDLVLKFLLYNDLDFHLLVDSASLELRINIV
ncbi:galactosyltransferase-like protein [Winogradskyella eximia]|uniref:Galactosyltransferase-like protein n=1 Tax=Winogradskyella eximia TaxID=262006 RepID=A0A3D9GPQ0_9FLAO|nr:glycosyltransferase [Winogradskyella eximia]RED38208.1 galactosyltransferase-like protein [Winogradskyella eximia]